MSFKHQMNTFPMKPMSFREQITRTVEPETEERHSDCQPKTQGQNYLNFIHNREDDESRRCDGKP